MFETSFNASAGRCHPAPFERCGRWNNEPDHLWDHPLLLAPDEEEEQWLAAQIEHQGAKVGAHLVSESIVEGGSYEPDAEERAEATQALADTVASWPTPPTGDMGTVREVESAQDELSIGTTAWRPTPEPEVIEGRFVSQSPRAAEEVEPAATRPTPLKRTRSRTPTPVSKAPVMRTAQRLPKRTSTPSFPPVGDGLTPIRSSAVVKRAPQLPDWPTRPSRPQSYRKENLDVFTNKQSRAAQRQAPIQRPLETTALKDNVLSSPDLDELELPAGRVPKRSIFPQKTPASPCPTACVLLMSTRSPPEKPPPKPNPR